MVILAFERSQHAVSQEAKNAMFKTLALAKRLVRELLAQELAERAK